MENKNNVDYYKTLNEKDLNLTKIAVDWTDKAFRGNGDCAAIARTTGKTCKVVLRDGEDTSFLEGIHVFLSLNARDAVPPTVLVRDDIADNVQESTLSKPASRPIFEPAIKKTSKTLSIVEMAEELKKYVHIISYAGKQYCAAEGAVG